MKAKYIKEYIQKEISQDCCDFTHYLTPTTPNLHIYSGINNVMKRHTNHSVTILYYGLLKH